MVESRSPIESYIDRVSPSTAQMDTLIAAYELIRGMIRKDSEDLNLLMYGSTVNGLMTMGTHNSDLDLTVINETYRETKTVNHIKKVEKIITRRHQEDSGWRFDIKKMTSYDATFGSVLEFPLEHIESRMKIEV